MLFLVSGSSGSGKTTLSRLVAERVPDVVVHELGELAEEPWDGERAWRRDLTERWLERAVEYAGEGRDLLLTEGVIGELLAAPSATRLDGIAACLVDCADEERLRRIHERAPDEIVERRRLWDFVSWGVWLRFHASDPQTWAGPLRGDGDETWGRWERWERWQAGDPRWSVFRLDTTGEPVERSVERLVAWIEEQRRLLAAGALPLSREWWDD